MFTVDQHLCYRGPMWSLCNKDSCPYVTPELINAGLVVQTSDVTQLISPQLPVYPCGNVIIGLFTDIRELLSDITIPANQDQFPVYPCGLKPE